MVDVTPESRRLKLGAMISTSRISGKGGVSSVAGGQPQET